MLYPAMQASTVGAVSNLANVQSQVCGIQARLFASAITIEASALHDVPVTHLHLASGRRKRRVDVYALNEALDRALAPADACEGPLEVMLERPTPIPALDGWQSAALSGARAV
jgi:hypothetical protein